MDVHVLKVEGPNAIWVKPLQSTGSPKGGAQQHASDFVRNMNEYLNTRLIWQYAVADAKKGKVYGVKDPASQLWQRAIVEEISHSSARCFMIDCAEMITVPINGLMALPPDLEHAQPLCHLCKLHGIMPLGMFTDFFTEGLSTACRPCLRWDAATSNWLRRQVEDRRATIEVVAECDNVWSIRLTLVANGNRYCVNDEMVRLQYAYTAADGKQKAPSPSVAPSMETHQKSPISLRQHTSSPLGSPDAALPKGRGRQTVTASPTNGTVLGPCGRGSIRSLMLNPDVSSGDGNSSQHRVGKAGVTIHDSPPATVGNVLPARASVTDQPSTGTSNSTGMLLPYSPTLVCRQDSSLSPTSRSEHATEFNTRRQLAFETASCMQSSKITAAELLASKVLVKGELLPKPCLSMQESQFPDCLHKFWNKWGCTTVHPVESYAWPTILRGLNVMAVSPVLPSESEMVAHDVLTYLLPITSMMMNSDAYKCLPIGNGPITIILASSWKKAFRIHNHIQLVLECWSMYKQQQQQQPRMRSRLLCGDKDDEESHSVPLLNGCEILCATPHSLLRMLNRGFTNLVRLCHFVFHDTDILVNEFEQQLTSIMEAYTIAKDNQDSALIPRQMLAFSHHCTSAMRSFVEQHMPLQAVIFTSKFEAAIYGRVKQAVRICKDKSEQTRYLHDMLDSTNVSALKTLIFTSNIDDARLVYKVLVASSYFVMLATEDMPSTDLDQVLHEWHTPHDQNSQPLLVLTDNVQVYLERCKPIRDARLLVHFDFPVRRQSFSDRLHCLSANYCESLTDKQKCASHVIMTATSATHTPALVKLLERLGERVPDALRAMAEDIIHVNEAKKMRELCANMKAFGECRAKGMCGGRHIVSAKLDTPRPGLPTSGQLKVMVLVVKDAATYYGRLLAHRENNVIQTMSWKKFEIDFDMQQYYSRKENKVHCHFEKIRMDELYAYEEANGLYSRAMVTGVECEASGIATTVWVTMVDDGRSEAVSPMKLFMLPSQLSLAATPAQVVEIRLCRVMPLDQDTDFSPKANILADKLAKGQTVEGNIALCLRNTIWLDPIVHREYLPSFRLWVSNWNLRDELLSKGLVVKNDQHVQLLRAACLGKVNLPAVKSESIALASTSFLDVPIADASEAPAPSSTAVSSCTVRCQELASSGTYTPVFVPVVHTPDLFFVNLNDCYGQLVELEERVNSHASSAGKVLPEVAVGCLCIARFPDDRRYYRAQVLSKHGDEAEVIFVDHGDIAAIDMRTLLELPDEFMQLPLQAIECCLAHVLPVDGEWPEKASDVIFHFTQTNGSNILLFAKVVQRTATATFIGSHRYSVELVNSSGSTDVSLSDVLVKNQVAVKRCTPIEERLAGIEFTKTSYDYEFQKIPEMYNIYLKLTEESEKSIVVEQICQIILEYSSYKDELRNCHALATLCQLVKDCKETPAPWLASVVHCLAVLAKGNKANCEEICLWEKTLPLIVAALLGPDAGSKLQEACSQALSYFVSCDSIKNVMKADGTIEQLGKFFPNTWNVKVQEHICEALMKFVQSNKRNCVLVGKVVPGIVAVLPHLAHADSVLVSVVRLLGILLSVPENHVILRETDGIRTVCNLLFKSANESVFTEYIKALTVLAENDESRAVIVAQEDIESKFRELMESLPPAMKLKCANLLQALSLRVLISRPVESGNGTGSQGDARPIPASKKLLLQPFSKDLPPLESIYVSHPPVFWRQTRRFVIVAVKQPDIIKPTVRYGKAVVDFKADVDGAAYEFQLIPLYADIVGQKCQVQVHKSEVLIALYKAEASKWPRLLQEGCKPNAAVKADFEALDDSSDDDEAAADDESSPFTSKKKVVLRYKRWLLCEEDQIPKSSADYSLPAGDLEDTSTSEDEFSDSDEDGDNFGI